MATTNAQPKILDLPIGLDATGTRREFDSLGDVQVPANRYWGAQTQRSLEHFNIGRDRMPEEVYRAYGYVKKAAALVNTGAGRLPACKGRLIGQVCDEVISGALDEGNFELNAFRPILISNYLHYAIDHDLTLKQAALANGVSEELYDRVDPLALTNGGSADLPAPSKPTAPDSTAPKPTIPRQA
jgi:hypothetical protein